MNTWEECARATVLAVAPRQDPYVFDNKDKTTFSMHRGTDKFIKVCILLKKPLRPLGKALGYALKQTI